MNTNEFIQTNQNSRNYNPIFSSHVQNGIDNNKMTGMKNSFNAQLMSMSIAFERNDSNDKKTVSTNCDFSTVMFNKPTGVLIENSHKLDYFVSIDQRKRNVIWTKNGFNKI